ncbi:solute carrier family 2, facilitated glucose transporter member 12 [Hemicordylus capensis]|uniref:solute carrier family 2, facilitated glucose transporter member 12 n=1 Tax=Hemicordylus capensis TaxID=884348 RepID=UPI00230489F9|nr:solute carrier family 2, facilitated glucose transporter member 12 [Hemicordylus capensis]XP_053143889.1 solute carrier family 2, facilitated glucose transporter member 12 [Hemicordylus capensis]
MVPVQNTEEEEEDLSQQRRKIRGGDCQNYNSSSSSSGCGGGGPNKLPAQTGCGMLTLLSSAVAAVSGLLMGYELGLISGALFQLTVILALSCRQQEIVVSALLIGAFLASLTGGFLIDKYGRRVTIILASCLLVLGSLILILFASYGLLITGRIAIGVSISLSSTATCVYIAEIAPQHRRGLLVSLNELMIVIGILFAYVSNYAFASVSHGWKYMFSLAIPLGTLQAIAMYFLLPSPRFLVMKGFEETASKVLGKLRATSDITEELAMIKSSLKDEHQYRFLDLFRSKDNMRVRMLIGITLVFFVQTTGQPNILFYASTVLKSVGFQSNEAASLASTGVGVVKVISTIPATLFVDHIGSKTFLCIGSSLMSLSLVTMGLVTLHIHMNFTTVCRNQPLEDPMLHGVSKLTSTNGTLQEQFVNMASSIRTSEWNAGMANVEQQNWTALEGGRAADTSQADSRLAAGTMDIPAALKWLSLASLLVYVAAFSIGLGPMSWLVLSEIFPGGIRGRAIALTSSVNWGVNLLISSTFLTITDLIGLPWIYFIYALMSLASLAFVIVFIPETRGCSLEQISTKLAKQKYASTTLCWMGQRQEQLMPMELSKKDSHEQFY